MMDLEKRMALLLIRMQNFAYKTGIDKAGANLFAEEALNKAKLELYNNPTFKQECIDDPVYFENYAFRILINMITNEKRRTKKLNPLRYNEKGELIDFLSKSPTPEEISIQEQKQTIMTEFIQQLYEASTEEEKEFLAVFMSLAEESGRLNVSKAGRLLGLDRNKAHNLFDRIKRKAEDLKGKTGKLEDIGTAQATFGTALSSFFGELFYDNPEDEITPESLEMAQKYMAKLSPADIVLLSRIL